MSCVFARTLLVALGTMTTTILALPADAAPKKAVKTAGNCKTHYGKGFDFTLAGAKFQSWEITAQVTGNWPFMSDTFKNERYKCKPDGSGFTCQSTIDVCKG